jgi:hypothetical protein
MHSLIRHSPAALLEASRRSILWKMAILAAVVCGVFSTHDRAIAAPYYLPSTGYAPARYYLGAPNYYGYYYRPWYLSPFRYSFYAAKYGWLYPRYCKPYHPYPLVSPYGACGHWYGFPGYAGGPFASSYELPAAVQFAGCDYW